MPFFASEDEGVGFPCLLPEGLGPGTLGSHNSLPKAAMLLAAVGRECKFEIVKAVAFGVSPLQHACTKKNSPLQLF